MKKLFVLFLLLTSCSASQSPLSDAPGMAVIYGDDSRTDIENLDPRAAATAHLVEDYNLNFSSNGQISYRVKKLKDSYPLCQNESFQEQPLMGFCSGVLIAPNRVLTAGHCLPRESSDCRHIRFHFGWTAAKAASSNTIDVLYSCKNVLQSENSLRKGLDYAILELDRDVTGITPVSISTRTKLSPDEPVLSLSYPLGLPLKQDLGKVLRDDSMGGGFKVAVDTFQGSSGSPLFDRNGELIGILSAGADDIQEDDIDRVQRQGGCINFNRCKTGTCFGETFTKTSLIPGLK